MFDGLARSLALLSNYIAGFAETTILVVELALASILVSWACGLAASLAQESRSRALDRLARFYIWFVRGTPTLIQIFIVYFGLPQFGLRLSPYVAGVLALGVNSGAFVAEILRSGLNAVPKHQRESARALGMRWLPEMWLVVLPQVLRVTLPSLTNEAITLLKNTSLLSAITVMELTLFSQMAIARTFRPFEFYIAAALIYLALTPCSRREPAPWGGLREPGAPSGRDAVAMVHPLRPARRQRQALGERGVRFKASRREPSR